MEINSREAIKKILEDCRTIAVVGLSSSPARASNGVAGYMKREGYKIIPVNPREEHVLGEKSYATSLEQRQCPVTQAVKKGNAEDRPIAPPKTVRQPAAQQRQKINRRAEQMQNLRRAVRAHLHPVLQIEFEDADHSVIAEPFARFVADDVFDLRREAVRRRSAGRGAGIADERHGFHQRQ